MDKNCPNCGAPYDVVLDKCPYCGTSYFDMSCIDVDGREPFYLKMRYRGRVFTSKVIADLSCIALSVDTVCVESPVGEKIVSFNTGRNADIDIRFHSLVDNNGNLFEVYN